METMPDNVVECLLVNLGKNIKNLNFFMAPFLDFFQGIDRCFYISCKFLNGQNRTGNNIWSFSKLIARSFELELAFFKRVSQRI